jgi:hypothetical protein
MSAIVVLGMHRSGTSSLAAMLVATAARAGKTLSIDNKSLRWS